MLRWLRALVRALGFSKENEQVADRFSKNERVALQEIRADEGYWAITPDGPMLSYKVPQGTPILGTSGYYDSEGFLTNGIGHRVPGVPKHPELRNVPVPGFDMDMEQAGLQFEDDFAKHLEFAKSAPGWDKASDRQKRGLMNLTFNMGAGWWEANPDRDTNKAGWPRFSAAAKSGDWEKASKELVDSQWYKQTGDRAPKVVSMIKPEIEIGMVSPMDRVSGTPNQGVMRSVGRR